jgi:hypothetical protein
VWVLPSRSKVYELNLSPAIGAAGWGEQKVREVRVGLSREEGNASERDQLVPQRADELTLKLPSDDVTR